MDMLALIQDCAPNVAETTMRAIVKVESDFRPHTIGQTIRKNGAVFRLARQPVDRGEAVQWAGWLLDNGYQFDAGIAQINSINFRAYGLAPENVFEPCVNIAAGAAILTDAYRNAARRHGEGQVALRAALSTYNTGSPVRGLANGYVAKVHAAAGKPLEKSRPPVTSKAFELALVYEADSAVATFEGTHDENKTTR